MTQFVRLSQRRVAPQLLAIGIVALFLSACASPPPPPQQALQAAESAIKNAEQARVADYASPELGVARTKLTAANAAVEREEMLLAERLAQQARVEAELALAKSQATKAQVVNDEMRKSTDSLKQEMQRNTGAQQ
jgi:predicted S18 family serine protease